ncbi:MAG: tagaturonate epimerase family protein [Treponema sp.]|nr:tagaturonate epimerase family protein [Treponema sp.]
MNNFNLRIFEKSSNTIGKTAVCMAKDGDKTVLIIMGQDKCGFKAEDSGEGKFKAELTHENAVVLRKHFPWTAPVKGLQKFMSFGFGDRLGLATPGHIELIRKRDIFPVFAQQSMRELTLTKRTYDDVLDAVTFAVFREGYKKGYGADGDHLKTAKDVQAALSLGFTMITLDCSDHIKNGASINIDIPQKYIDKYLNVEFDIEGIPLVFTKEELAACITIYSGVISFAAEIYRDFFASGKYDADLEISIDETESSTTPLQHYFVARELLDNEVVFATIAPRFCGEFQKGIDYIGDMVQFEKEINIHAAVARSLGYKLSIHSGSDKFSVFPIIAKACRGNFHLKTAGTNWLEAMRVAAAKDPGLYREIHKYAFTVFDEAKKYYHVTADITKIPGIQEIKDDDLPGLFDNSSDLRQLIHITYGFILDVYKDRLYALWHMHEDEYRSAIVKHIGRHLELLG